MEQMNCYECGDKTSERCGYCLLPVCHGHGERVQLWYTRHKGIVCHDCAEKLRSMGLLPSPRGSDADNPVCI